MNRLHCDRCNTVIVNMPTLPLVNINHPMTVGVAFDPQRIDECDELYADVVVRYTPRADFTNAEGEVMPIKPLDLCLDCRLAVIKAIYDAYVVKP